MLRQNRSLAPKPKFYANSTDNLKAFTAAPNVPKRPEDGLVVPNRVFVGGFPSNTSSKELKDYFAKFGMVRDVKIIEDKSGENKGSYAFITFDQEIVVKRILDSQSKGSSHLVFKDRRLNIGKAIKKQVKSVNDKGVFKAAYQSYKPIYNYSDGLNRSQDTSITNDQMTYNLFNPQIPSPVDTKGALNPNISLNPKYTATFVAAQNNLIPAANFTIDSLNQQVFVPSQNFLQQCFAPGHYPITMSTFAPAPLHGGYFYVVPNGNETVALRNNQQLNSTLIDSGMCELSSSMNSTNLKDDKNFATESTPVLKSKPTSESVTNS